MKLRGGVEYVRDGKIVGWSALADPPDGAGFVSIYEDDKLIGTALADIYRDDGADGPTTQAISLGGLHLYHRGAPVGQSLCAVPTGDTV